MSFPPVGSWNVNKQIFVHVLLVLRDILLVAKMSCVKFRSVSFSPMPSRIEKKQQVAAAANLLLSRESSSSVYDNNAPQVGPPSPREPLGLPGLLPFHRARRFNSAAYKRHWGTLVQKSIARLRSA
jgi:hypothetical protein